MCVIIGDSGSHPTDTKIYNFPVTVNDSKNGHLLIYKNKFNFKRHSNLGEIMILVVPTEEKNIGFVDADTNNISFLLSKVNDAGEQLIRYDSTAYSSLTNSFSVDSAMRSETAKVYKVGNYKLSVLFNPTVEQIEKLIDWSVFSKPFDLKSRLNTINDPQLFPFSNKAVIFCMAVENIDDSGVGIVYFSDKTIFPTCHENTGNNIKRYDCTLYNFYENIDKPKPVMETTFKLYDGIQYSKNANRINTIYEGKPASLALPCKKFIGLVNNVHYNAFNNLLSLSNVLLINGEETKIKLNPVKYMSVIPILGRGLNQNLIE